MNRFIGFRLVRYALAPLLSLWIAGAGCMLGCEGMMVSASEMRNHHATDSSSDLAQVVSGDACSSAPAKTHDCCKKQHAKSKRGPVSEGIHTVPSNTSHPSRTQLAGSSSGRMNECPLAASRATIVGKVRTGESNATATLVQTPVTFFDIRELTTSLSPTARLPNRGHTYLRCCVFLI